MAIQTFRPLSRTRRQGISPSRGYRSVVSRFAGSIQQAISDQEEAGRREAIVQYKAGNITFDQLKGILKEKINDLPEGTLKKVKAEEQLVEVANDEQNRIRRAERARLEEETIYKRKERARLTNILGDKGINPLERLKIEQELLRLETPGTQDYEQQQRNVVNATDNAETYKIEKLKVQLLDKYKEGGITPQEELAIIQELRRVANPDSEIASKLAEREAQIQTDIAQKATSEGRTAGNRNAAAIIEQNFIQNKDITEKYQSNPILYPGLQVDQALLHNWQEIGQALSSGAQIKGITIGTAREQIALLEQKIKERQSGQRFDILDSKNQVKSVTLREIQNDTAGSLTRLPVTQNEKGNWQVRNPFTQQTKEFGSEGAAKAYAKNNGIKEITVLNEGGAKRYFNDTKTNSFVRFDNQGKPEGRFNNIVGIPTLENQFRITEATSDKTGFSLPSFSDVGQFIQKSVEQFNKPITAKGIGTSSLDVEKLIQEGVKGIQANISPVISKVAEAGKQFLTEPIKAQGIGQRNIQIQPTIQPIVQRVQQATQDFLTRPITAQGIGKATFEVPKINVPNIDFLGDVRRIAAPVTQQIQQTAAPFIQRAQAAIQPAVSRVQQIGQGIGSFFGGLFGRKK